MSVVVSKAFLARGCAALLTAVAAISSGFCIFSRDAGNLISTFRLDRYCSMFT